MKYRPEAKEKVAARLVNGDKREIGIVQVKEKVEAKGSICAEYFFLKTRKFFVGFPVELLSTPLPSSLPSPVYSLS